MRSDTKAPPEVLSKSCRQALRPAPWGFSQPFAPILPTGPSGTGPANGAFPDAQGEGGGRSAPGIPMGLRFPHDAALGSAAGHQHHRLLIRERSDESQLAAERLY